MSATSLRVTYNRQKDKCNRPEVDKGITAVTIEGVSGFNETENLRQIGIKVRCKLLGYNFNT